MSEHGGAGFACGSAGLAMPPSLRNDAPILTNYISCSLLSYAPPNSGKDAVRRQSFSVCSGPVSPSFFRVHPGLWPGFSPGLDRPHLSLLADETYGNPGRWRFGARIGYKFAVKESD